MRKIPPNSTVRRRLFAEDDNPTQQATIDNFANVLQESNAKDRDNMMKKWNFDFSNEVPLDGPIEWYKREGTNWIRIKPDKPEPEGGPSENDKCPLNIENEVTPKTNKNETVPLGRKRRREVDVAVNDKGARRKISFD